MTEKLVRAFSPHGTPPSMQTNLHTHALKLMPTHSAHGSFQAVINQDELVCIIRAKELLNSSYNLYYQIVKQLARVILNLDELESFLIYGKKFFKVAELIQLNSI